MCDQTEVSYLEDDVVWVKIGPIWWPGVVKDLEKDEEGKEILAGFKKKPIAVVKFFQEDNYEFVKNLEHIYHYSCRRKDEFIKKGLDKFRTGAAHMKKFPADVTTAESLTNGDINYVNDPKFFPEKKESYSEIFGSGKKKSKKESEVSPKLRSKTSANVTPFRPITHQRFINKALHGESDHKIKTLIQSNASPDDGAAGKLYKCHICKFETSRVNVIVSHHRLSHSSKNSINWTGSESRFVRKKPVHKSRKIKSKRLDLSKDDESEGEEEESEKKKFSKIKNFKERPKTSTKSKNDNTSSPPKRKTKEDLTSSSDSKKPRFTDVLLADWNVDEEEEADKKGKDQSESNSKNAESVVKDTKNESFLSEECLNSSNTPTEEKNQKEKMSCFDFDEDDEGFIGMSNANTYGRKIPRVIPVKDKTELGMDLEIEELFKKKTEEELENSENFSANAGTETQKTSDSEIKEAANEESKIKPGKRRRSKASKDEEAKVSAEDSLALRRTRRPGAKKSYLNEVIEKIEDDNSQTELVDAKDVSLENNSTKLEVVKLKEEPSSSSRRKQDFKLTMDAARDEVIYPEIVNSEQQKGKTPEKKVKGQRQTNERRQVSEDLTTQVDNLLEETKMSTLPTVPPACDKGESFEKSDLSASGSNGSFTIDCLPGEQIGKKIVKNRTEMKSISRIFSDSFSATDGNTEAVAAEELPLDSPETKEVLEDKISDDSDSNKNISTSSLKIESSSEKRGSIVLTSVSKNLDSGQLRAVPVSKQPSKDSVALGGGKKFDENVDDDITESEIPRTRNIKAIKVKSDSLPSSLLTAGKLKGQTIIHQKGGKYVIVTQPPQAGRQRTTPAKVQPGSKVVILTNQLGEQKIITASGLQQSKFKIDGQKIMSVDSEKEIGNTSGSSVGQAQPVIKMVPDGKGGIMKQLTVSQKKVLVGGTKVLVSGSGSTLASGNSGQKIALSTGGGVARGSSGDFRLIENYKGSGKTVLIQGGNSSGSGVVLKSSGIPRQVSKVIQGPQNVSALKKKPKILMRASAAQGDYVVQSASCSVESPTILVKQKGNDGQFATQKIVRTEIFNQPKTTTSGSGTKTFFVSGQGKNKKGESYIITTNESVPGKVIRMRQKVKEIDSPKSTQKLVQKSPEVYSMPENSLLISNRSPAEEEIPQLLQVQDQPPQPVLQTQVIAMPGPVGADGNQTYVLVSVDENGVVQSMDNSVVTYDPTAQSEQIFVNPTSTNNVILINSHAGDEVTPVYSTSSQDILAEALANTNVLDGSISSEIDPVVPSILLPPTIPSSVVQETSITLQKPIMTPLEMPSSVTPDTSGLEPPPLPPTPTEDVLLEEPEITPEDISGHEQHVTTIKNQESDDPMKNYLRPAKSPEEESEQTNESSGENEKTENKTSEKPEEDTFTQIEFSPKKGLEESNNPSFQSLPVLNDEPDTSDDAQNSDPIPDQHFSIEKSQLVIREQEPPSSTNNEIITEEKNEETLQGFTKTSPRKDIEQIVKDDGKMDSDQTSEEEQKEKENVTESHSLPIIVDENNTNLYETETGFTGTATQKRFQEETEVSSTTDEFSSKENN